MSQIGSKTDRMPNQKTLITTLVTVSIQVGCSTLFIIIVTLIIGLLLDRLLDTRPLFTILFVVGSVPATWVVILWIVNRAKKRIPDIYIPSNGEKLINSEEIKHE